MHLENNEDLEVVATEIESIVIDGTDARVFDITSSDVGTVAFKTHENDLNDEVFGWDLPAAGRLWLIDHPERGLLAIGAKAFDDVAVQLPQVTAWAEQFIESMQFVDVG